VRLRDAPGLAKQRYFRTDVVRVNGRRRPP